MLQGSCFTFCSGWLFKLELKNPDELKQLMDEKAYAAFLKSQNTDEH
jgi:glycine cleavage system H lipoate-binding protein